MTSSANLEIIISAINATNQTLRQIRSDLVGLDAPAQKASKSLGTLQTIAKAGIVLQGAREAINVLGSTVTAASDASESLNKERVVFGSASKDIESFARNSARDLGLSNQATLEAAGTFGNLFTAMGLGQPKAAEMSKGILKLAADLGSFNNIKPEVALEKLQAGLVGEERPLRELGVNLNAASVAQRAVSLGLAKQGDELNAAQKAQAAYSLILEQTTAAQGDFARTSGGMANQTRILNAEVKDLQANLGKLAVPPLTISIKGLNETLEFLKANGNAGAGDRGQAFAQIGKGIQQFYQDIAAGKPSLEGFHTALTEGTDKATAYERRLSALGESEAADVAPTVELSGALSDLDRHLAGLDISQRNASNSGSLLVAQQLNNLRATADTARATEDAYKALAASDSESDRAIAATHYLALEKAGLAEQAQRDAEAERAYAQTLPGMVQALYDEAAATRLQVEAKIEYNRELGIATDLNGNAILSFQQLVEQEKQSILHSQEMAKVTEEANRELGIVPQVASAAGATLKGLSSDAQQVTRSFSDIGMAVDSMGLALKENFGGDYSGPKPGETNAQFVARTSGGGGSTGGSSGGGSPVYSGGGGSSTPAYSSGGVRRAVSAGSFSRASASKSAPVVHNTGTVINGNVYVTTSAQSFNAMSRI